MEYLNVNGKEVLCVSGKEIIISDKNPNGIVSASLVDKWKRDDDDENNPLVLQRACYGRSLLLNFNRIPSKYRDKIAVKLGTPAVIATVKPFKDKIIMDGNAVAFYSNYTLADGRLLPDYKAREYAVNASVLNAVKDVYLGMKQSRSKLGRKVDGFWPKAIMAVNEVRSEYQHSLPSKETPLKRTYKGYIDGAWRVSKSGNKRFVKGYESLISGKYCNDNSRKVNDKVENLIMSLYVMPNKPFQLQTHIHYTMFMNGQIQVVDQKTGELFNPEDFYENGQPIIISESTVRNYLNQPHNRSIVDSLRMGSHRYNNTHRPHHHRHAPNYSFSKVSMDDRDLPRKCDNGKWVKSYYAYDVTSGAVIGYAHSEFKNEQLFLDCLRNMLQLIYAQGWGMPMEVEVEHHLVNHFFDDLAQMFPFLRICRAGNSQEKRAEHFNRAKKYGEEKNSQNNIGRWWSKHEAYTVDRDRKGDEMVDKVVLPYERLVADDVKSIYNYNNQLHPKQKKYPGKTRWQVLVENMNPNVVEPNKPVVYKAIGCRTETSINRNQYAPVRGNKYQIANIGVLEKLSPGNNSVIAYWLPDNEGVVSEVFLYQMQSNKEVFLCRAEKLISYNESAAERTDTDLQAFTKQAKFVAQYDATIKRDKAQLASAVIIKSEALNEALETKVELAPPVKTKEEFNINELLNTNFNDDEDAGDSL